MAETDVHYYLGFARQKTYRYRAWGIAEVLLADTFTPLFVRFLPFKVVNPPVDLTQLAAAVHM